MTSPANNNDLSSRDDLTAATHSVRYNSNGAEARNGSDYVRMEPSATRDKYPNERSGPYAILKRPPGESEALADQLSSSLASIAAAGRTAATRHNNNGSDSSGSCRGNASANVVTGTSTTMSSGGDDRDSSGSGARRASSGLNVPEKRHYHLHHRYHITKKESTEGNSSSGADGYGLPALNDDRWSQAKAAHTTVVAQLPPPNSDATSSAGSAAETEKPEEQRLSLVQPHREPGFHTIRRTFNRLVRRDTSKSTETDSTEGQVRPLHHHKPKSRSKATSDPVVGKRKSHARKDDHYDSHGNGSSSGSGTEGGYAGSASSNENAAQVGSCSSPSLSSSEEEERGKRKRPRNASAARDPHRPLLSKKQETAGYTSSEIADFSSGSSEGEANEGGFAAAFRQSQSRSPSITSSSDEQDDGYTRERLAHKVSQKGPGATARWPPLPLQVPGIGNATSARPKTLSLADQKPAAMPKGAWPTLDGKPPIMAVGCDVMAHILTFLEPPDILDVLTMPLSKDWLGSFTRQPELWRVLCLLDPFKAEVDTDSDESSDSSVDSYSLNGETELRRTFGKFRLLYTSFVRCMRYLSRIKDDALHGRPPSMIDYGAAELLGHNVSANQNLQQFLARARGVVVGRLDQSAENSDISDDEGSQAAVAAAVVARASPIGVSDDGSSTSPNKRRATRSLEKKKKKRKVRYAHSTLTQRLLGPTAAGTAGNVELPWSCTIYSIVNWMVSFATVEGIQTMCLRVLPFLLEDEQQRMTAQRAGLTDIVLRGMVMFPNSCALHTAAFHTIVLLARPLGGREGMLFHTSMVNSSGIFSPGSGSADGKNGIAVMLDSMRRFQDNELLQAMSCWSLVNIALAPAQKEMLVRLGGIEVAANAMTAHPYNAEVQFRALFALINLVIPSVSVNGNAEEDGETVPLEDTSEREMLDDMVNRIIQLVVTSMKNFCASEAVLNRACLVLHNLSLTQGMLCSTTCLLISVCQRLTYCSCRVPFVSLVDSQLLPDARVVSCQLPDRPSVAAKCRWYTAPPADHPQQ